LVADDSSAFNAVALNDRSNRNRKAKPQIRELKERFILPSFPAKAGIRNGK
jgi:hypothetical protein